MFARGVCAVADSRRCSRGPPNFGPHTLNSRRETMARGRPAFMPHLGMRLITLVGPHAHPRPRLLYRPYAERRRG